MVLVFVVALAAVVVLAVRRRESRQGRGWLWFRMWALAAAVFFFALATGFSIGLVIAPFAIALLFWVGHRSPHGAEALGVLVGLGADLVLFGLIDDWQAGWVAGGAAIITGASAYAALVTRRERQFS